MGAMKSIPVLGYKAAFSLSWFALPLLHHLYCVMYLKESFFTQIFLALFVRAHTRLLSDQLRRHSYKDLVPWDRKHSNLFSKARNVYFIVLNCTASNCCCIEKCMVNSCIQIYTFVVIVNVILSDQMGSFLDIMLSHSWAYSGGGEGAMGSLAPQGLSSK